MNASKFPESMNIADSHLQLIVLNCNFCVRRRIFPFIQYSFLRVDGANLFKYFLSLNISGYLDTLYCMMLACVIIRYIKANNYITFLLKTNYLIRTVTFNTWNDYLFIYVFPLSLFTFKRFKMNNFIIIEQTKNVDLYVFPLFISFLNVKWLIPCPY